MAGLDADMWPSVPRKLASGDDDADAAGAVDGIRRASIARPGSSVSRIARHAIAPAVQTSASASSPSATRIVLSNSSHRCAAGG